LRKPADTRLGIAEVTTKVALPFVAAVNGIAAGEPAECFNPPDQSPRYR
jgi:hypothetical protein